jgi:hypothetical protein
LARTASHFDIQYRPKTQMLDNNHLVEDGPECTGHCRYPRSLQMLDARSATPFVRLVSKLGATFGHVCFLQSGQAAR